jgi:hypothetical protein
MSVKCGDTFMLENTDGLNEHLHVVITNPTLGGEVITVNISTRSRLSETLVCVHPDEHPFVRHESIVPYHYAAIRKCADIEKALASGEARSKDAISADLLQRITAGLRESDFTPPEVRYFYEAIVNG